MNPIFLSFPIKNKVLEQCFLYVFCIRPLRQAARQEWTEAQVLSPICGPRPAFIVNLAIVLLSLWTEALGFSPPERLRPPLS